MDNVTVTYTVCLSWPSLDSSDFSSSIHLTLAEETQYEIEELLENVPALKENFLILDKIGEGMFAFKS